MCGALSWQVVKRSLTPSFWERMIHLRLDMDIAQDPYSFQLYVKDLIEVPLLPTFLATKRHGGSCGGRTCRDSPLE